MSERLQRPQIPPLRVVEPASALGDDGELVEICCQQRQVADLLADVHRLPVAALRLVPLPGLLRHHSQLVPDDRLALRLAQRAEGLQRFGVALPCLGQVATFHRQRAQLAEGSANAAAVINLTQNRQCCFVMLLCIVKLPYRCQVIRPIHVTGRRHLPR